MKLGHSTSKAEEGEEKRSPALEGESPIGRAMKGTRTFLEKTQLFRGQPARKAAGDRKSTLYPSDVLPWYLIGQTLSIARKHKAFFIISIKFRPLKIWNQGGWSLDLKEQKIKPNKTSFLSHSPSKYLIWDKTNLQPSNLGCTVI